MANMFREILVVFIQRYMSTYPRQTKNPKTGEYETAVWIDNFYGPHHYGVEFPGGEMYDPEKTDLPTKDEEKHMKYTVYACNKDGDGHIQTIGEYEELDDIELRVGMFAKDVVLMIEEIREEIRDEV